MLQGTATIKCKEGCPIGYSGGGRAGDVSYRMATGGVGMQKCLVSPALGNAMIPFWAAKTQNNGLKWPVDAWYTVQHIIIFGVLCGYVCVPTYYLRIRCHVIYFHTRTVSTSDFSLATVLYTVILVCELRTCRFEWRAFSGGTQSR